MPHLDTLPEDATLMQVFTRHPAVSQALMALHDAIMRDPAPFTAAQREAIAAYVSQLNACEYCHGVHTSAAIGLGESAENVQQICELPETPPDPKLAPVLTYVRKLTLSPATVSKADADRILAAGWDEDAVSFAAYVAALYGFMNRLVEGHGIKGTPEYHAMGGKRLAEIGYAGLAELLKQHA